ncbi:RNA polymerase sigma-70 factor, ECF subfamily protein [Paenibacillus sp. IHB B 3415]|uniref:RNA polymerase sigma factor n=1 Tax=Paenibacillus sp. IHB B 3415 TaxID=867080 RepID=UPI00057509A6|nr:sigma-70 family RNA polymerase sigma factor [Paenibacillus sp. IHB B 3415]KHL96227.1 RNA polymerase sigma-70 factor, ECF subfamily protein [Paenibacillus sp. IHB B 3415]
MEDQGIVHLYLQRSQQAIVETKNKYGAYCRVIARNIISNLSDIDECENDTYLAAWNAIPPTMPRKLSVFLGRITRNIVLDRYSYNTAKKRNRQFDAILTELEGCIASPDTVEGEYEAGETASLINEFLYGIEEQARNIFIRRYWYSDSIEELAMRFQMSSSKVKSILFRTRHKLRAHLAKGGVHL